LIPPSNDIERRAPGRLLFAATLITLLAPCFAFPQESRAELLQQQRAAKAQQIAPYKPDLVERLMAFAGEKESGGKPLGWYPYFGSIFTGGAVAAGAGYRLPFKDTGQIELEAAVSYRLYKKIDLKVDLPRLLNDKLRIRTRGLWLDATKVNFFGVGNDTLEDAKSTFRFSPLTFETRAIYDARSWLSVGAGVEYIVNDLGRGRTAPSIEELYTPETAPGLDAEPNYIIGRTFVDVDTRPHDGYSTSGGRYRADFSYFSDRDQGQFSFRRFDAEASQLVPLLRANWVIALRGLVTMTGLGDGKDVPYFLLPSLGSSRDLRGYHNFRFRDRHRLLLTAEYRWTPSRLADMVLFVDGGKVAAEASDLDFTGLHDDYGIGVRFHTTSETVLRLEYARSSEGSRFIFGVGPNF
jgi:outer membrane protein assembly factor BamA